MILVDTSVWIDHLRKGNARLQQLLLDDQVLCHDFVIGELACGNLKDRQRILGMMASLPRAVHAEQHEVIQLIEDRKLSGKGIGWLDAHLIASTLMSRTKLWTNDRRLGSLASILGLNA